MKWKMRPLGRVLKDVPWGSALKRTQRHAASPTIDLIWNRVTQPMEDFDDHITWPLQGFVANVFNQIDYNA